MIASVGFFDKLNNEEMIIHAFAFIGFLTVTAALLMACDIAYNLHKGRETLSKLNEEEKHEE